MKVAFLTSGGIAPCLSSSIARLIYNYSKLDKDIEFIGYFYGYKGLFLLPFPDELKLVKI